MSETLKKIQDHPDFADFFLPLEAGAEVRDATYFLRNDGTFLFSEGYCHDPASPLDIRRLVCHIVYTPKGDREIPEKSGKTLFGERYENVTREIMLSEPLNRIYPLQLERYYGIDPSLNVERNLPYRYKVLVPFRSILGSFPHLHTLTAITRREDRDARRIERCVALMCELLDIPPEHVGISGSASLGTYRDPHDLDFVIYGTVAENRRITDFMYEMTKREENRRVYEFGKFWPIRYWEEVDGEKIMICPFFSYLEEAEIPLKDFTCEPLAEVEAEGRVCDHTHNAYNPSLLLLERVMLDGKEKGGEIPLVIYHGAERGDYGEGDLLKARAHHVRVQTFRGEGAERRPEKEFEALLVVNFGQIEKLEGA